MATYEPRRGSIEPLWDRVDRNRRGLAVFVLVFIVLLSTFIVLCISAVLLVFAVVGLSALEEVSGRLTVREVWLPAILGALPVALAGVVGYVAWAMTRPEHWFADRLGAVLAPRGELLEVKHALKDMAIASGFDVAPALYVIETPNVNAFLFGRSGRRAIVGVTRGLVERLEITEQRAVFANLMARLRSGDNIRASGVTALVAPLWRLRDTQMTAPDDELTRPPGGRDSRLEQESNTLALFAPMAAFVVLSELLLAGDRRVQLRNAEKADAEGMLLLKEPGAMLSALEKTVRFNNYVPTAGNAMGQLFYAWTGESGTDDETDPENVRVARLREVLGAEGIADAPLATRNVAILPVAPPAPRLEAALPTGSVLFRHVGLPPIAAVWFALAAGVVSASGCASFANFANMERPVYGVPPTLTLAEYASRYSSLEVRMLVIAALSAALFGILSGGKARGILIAQAAALPVLATQLMVSSVAPGFGIGGRFVIALALATTSVAGLAGGTLGSLWRARVHRRRLSER